MIVKLCFIRVCHYHCGLISYFYEIPEIRSVWYSMLHRDGKCITLSYFTVSLFEHCTVQLTATTCLFGGALMDLVMQLFKAIALNFVNKDSGDWLIIIQLKYIVHRKHTFPNACGKCLSRSRVRFVQVNESCVQALYIINFMSSQFHIHICEIAHNFNSKSEIFTFL